MGMYYGGQNYIFSKNLQGDVIGVYNESRQLVAKYSYNAFGEITAITDASGNDVSSNSAHIANINPFRYRGYYYDAETGFYYLNSRYYDPVVGRFLNADAFVSTGQGILGNNMFAYCGNNPVMYIDPEGECPLFILPFIVKIIKRVIAYFSFVNMEVSDGAIELIKDCEQFTPVKIDEGDYGAIGYGHSAYHNDSKDPYSSRNTITMEEAHDLLVQDAKKHGEHIKQYALERGLVLTQQQFDAYVLYSYNTGWGRVPDVMDLIMQGTDVFDAFNYRLNMQKDVYKLGLYRRWYDSADMYVNGDYNRDYPYLP